jgi:hypothetical protein
VTLLKSVTSGQGKRNQYTVLYDGDGMKQTREEAASGAGLSERQKVTALRVANVDPAVRDALIESDNPPTMSVSHRLYGVEAAQAMPPAFGLDEPQHGGPGVGQIEREFHVRASPHGAVERFGLRPVERAD